VLNDRDGTSPCIHLQALRTLANLHLPALRTSVVKIRHSTSWFITGRSPRRSQVPKTLESLFPWIPHSSAREHYHHKPQVTPEVPDFGDFGPRAERLTPDGSTVSQLYSLLIMRIRLHAPPPLQVTRGQGYPQNLHVPTPHWEIKILWPNYPCISLYKPPINMRRGLLTLPLLTPSWKINYCSWSFSYL
jgi:hypothetical protein